MHSRCIEVPKIAREDEIVLNFIQGAMGDVQEVEELLLALSSMTFRNIRRERDTRTSYLCAESIPLISREPTRELIDLEDKLMSFLPDVQILKRSHRVAFSVCCVPITVCASWVWRDDDGAIDR